MTFFKKIYAFIKKLSQHPYAVFFLMALTFTESWIFPIPPDPLYVALALEKKRNPFKLAFYCTFFSVLGGILGYYIGHSFYNTLGSWIVKTYHLQDKVFYLRDQLKQFGFWIIILKGLTPIPYKLVTLGCGFLDFPFTSFVGASVISRGLRFFSMAFVLKYYGEKINDLLERHFWWISLLFLGLLVGGVWVLYR
jgi:membrane protein YqaA with SNARE-associated domain